MAHIDRPLLGKITSASMPSRSMSRSRCSGSAPASWRSRSSPSSSSVRSRSGRWPSDTRHFTPLASTMTRGTRSRYFASMRVAHRSAGSLACASAETMKYFRGSPGRAVRGQLAWPGVVRRQRLGSLMVELGRAHARPPPVHQRERGRRVVVRLEHGLHGRADRHRLLGIAEKIADHPDAARVRQLDQDHDVGPAAAQRGMHRMPRALPGVDRPRAARRRVPRQVEAEAAVADPLRAPLPAAAARGSAARAARRAACPPSTARRARRARAPGAAGRPAGGRSARSQQRPRCRGSCSTRA